MNLIGLADCNSFYASCERLFRPDLTGKPIVVLSNNDGCIVALSKEAKALGIKRGTPYFQEKDRLKAYGVAVFSSNYTLYQDISDRIMNMLEVLTCGIEKYSIDEAFFYPGTIKTDKLAFYLRKGVGVPVSIGLARTKTLAKIANHIAKKGNLSFYLEPAMEESVLRKVPIDDVWGIGWRGVPKAKKLGINTAWDFAQKDDDWILKNFTVSGYNTARELRGIKMIDKERAAHLSVSSSISFANPENSFEKIQQAMVCHCTTVCEKLYSSGYQASDLYFQILTKRWTEDCTNTYGCAHLNIPSYYVPDFVKAGNQVLPQIFHAGYGYRSMRVIAWNLSKAGQRQFSLFDGDNVVSDTLRKDRLTETVNSYHKGTIQCGTSGYLRKKDIAHHDYLSPCYTTQWDSLPVAGRSDRQTF